MNWTPEELQSLVDDHPLVLFMKGSPNLSAGFPTVQHRCSRASVRNSLR